MCCWQALHLSGGICDCIDTATWQNAESRPRVYYDRERVNQNDHLGRVLFNGVVRDTYDCG